MNYNELSTAEKARFKNSNICPICGNTITKEDRNSIFIKKVGRFKKYIFYHEDCYDEYIQSIQSNKETSSENISAYS